MAVPKKKMSRMRTRQRKAQWKVDKPTLSTCSQCKSPRLPHRACGTCGTYNGREVVATD
ncbi:MAG: 50S ribosomal protein L32 [Acidimicrobiia bacterium]